MGKPDTCFFSRASQQVLGNGGMLRPRKKQNCTEDDISGILLSLSVTRCLVPHHPSIICTIVVVKSSISLPSFISLHQYHWSFVNFPPIDGIIHSGDDYHSAKHCRVPVHILRADRLG